MTTVDFHFFPFATLLDESFPFEGILSCTRPVVDSLVFLLFTPFAYTCFTLYSCYFFLRFPFCEALTILIEDRKFFPFFVFALPPPFFCLHFTIRPEAYAEGHAPPFALTDALTFR